MKTPITKNFFGKRIALLFGKSSAALFTGGILVVFLSFLLIVNYRSQMRLRETALSQLVQNLDKQAGAISYFFSERIIDMKNLAAAREANIFFENQALGMSMLYGLRASLVQIDKRIDGLMEERKIGISPVYSRIVFLDTTGTILSDRHSETDGLECTLAWKDFLSPDTSGPVIVAHRDDQHLDLLMSTPYFFKEKYSGHIIAWLNRDTLCRDLVSTGQNLPGKHIFIDFAANDMDSMETKHAPGTEKDSGTGDAVILSSEIESRLLGIIRKAPPKKTILFEFRDLQSEKKHYVGTRVPIAATSFFLIMALPASEVLGYASPLHLLLAMMVLAVFVAGATLLLWRMNARALILTTRLNEENMRKKEVEQLVQDRTLELEQTQKELLNKAVEAGRAQLSAMVLHNIGNAITPVSVNMELLKKSDIKPIIDYLLQCYNDLSGHRDDLTHYVKEDPRGIQVSEYMGVLIRNLETERTRATELIRKTTTAIEYVSQVLSLQRTYAPGTSEMKENINLNHLLEDALRIQESSITKRNIEIEKNFLSDIPGFPIEKNKLMQVLVNFIKNSCDAIEESIERNVTGCLKGSPEDTLEQTDQEKYEKTHLENPDVTGHEDPDVTDEASSQEKRHWISMTTFKRENRVGVSISDSGCGVEKERQQEIFEFGISSKGSSGFGLYYCKSFVEANNGTLTLKSDGRDEGTTIVIEFPANQMIH